MGRRTNRLQGLWRDIGLLCTLVGALWALEIFDQLVFGEALDRLGIIPRQRAGLLGIFCAPWLHAGYRHLASNTVPLFVLGGFVLLRGRRQFFAVSLYGTVLGGIGVWLIGRGGSLHVGASGVIFAYLGYLLTAGVLERSAASVGLALLAAFLYGGLLWGVLPAAPGVSWEAHLCGMLAGALAARWTRTRRPARSRQS